MPPFASEATNTFLVCFALPPAGDALEVLLARLALIRSQLSAAQAAAEQDPHPAALITFRWGVGLDKLQNGRTNDRFTLGCF
jgi:hypothetical protein